MSIYSRWAVHFRIITIVLLALLVAATVSVAASAGLFNVDRSALFPGGKVSSGVFEVQGSIGQPVVGGSAAGGFEHQAGYHASAGTSGTPVRESWKDYE